MSRRAVVTGAAGFIGSQLTERLLVDGWSVTGVDGLVGPYPVAWRELYLRQLEHHEGFTLERRDLSADPIEDLVAGADVVFHLAALPGVRASWSSGFGPYLQNNVLATQRLLEAARATTRPRIVYASSASIYGNAPSYPVDENEIKRPHSPYGVSKLAAEHLCHTYADNFGLEVVSLRYFSVYGPRQRPDMGIHRLIEASLSGEPFTVYGDGEQVRDMTFVGDVIAATILAADEDAAVGQVLNIAGGSEVSLLELISLVGDLTGQPIRIRHVDARPGDVARTGGRTKVARDVLRWRPRVGLHGGITSQVAWHRELRADPPNDGG